jgi:hypothetical protein
MNLWARPLPKPARWMPRRDASSSWRFPLVPGRKGPSIPTPGRRRTEGLSADELQQVAVLAITTLGFPAAMAGLSWMRDVLEEKS